MSVEPLISAAEIEARVEELAHELSLVYTGRPLTIVGVLTGSLILLADLVRRITVPHRIDVVSASSYHGAQTRPGPLTIQTDQLGDIRQRDVLLLDDIFDTGHTMTTLSQAIEAEQPLSVQTAVLLWKQGRSEVDLEPNYAGFKIEDRFVVGYGLDYDGDYRHLPYIGVLNEPPKAC